MAGAGELPFVPSMKATLSYASPEKAAQIRSAVTGALKRDDRSGLFCFEHTVETTFVLPWDLHPRAAPLRLSVAARDRVRTELLDEAALAYLEARAAVNWGSEAVKWQCRPAAGKFEWVLADHVIAAQLEASYFGGDAVGTFVAGFVNLQVDHASHRLLNTQTGELFEIRRLGLAPLMPMKARGPPPPLPPPLTSPSLLFSLQTEEDVCSLFHAASMGLWGVHDRTSLLLQAVELTLADPKAMFPIYDRWTAEALHSPSPDGKTVRHQPCPHTTPCMSQFHT